MPGLTRDLRGSDLLVGLAAILLAGGCGAAFARDDSLGLAATAGIALLTVAIVSPVAVAVVALCGVYAVQRFGAASPAPGSSGGITYSDLLLTGASLLALAFIARRGSELFRRVRSGLLVLAFYLACLLPTVFLHSTQRGALEWAHRAVLVGGALLVGLWISVEHAERAALRWLLSVSLFIAVATMVNAARNGFAPGEPFQLNKNLIGSLLALVLVVVLLLRSTLELDRAVHAVAVLVLVGGTLASQSRGGQLAAVFGLLVAFLVDARQHTRRAVVLAGAVMIALGITAAVSINDQFKVTSADFNNGSIGVRLNVEKQTRAIWRTSPITGVGLRYFSTGEFGPSAQAANNVIDNELAESGLVGLGGFVVLQTGLFVVGVRRRRAGPLVAVGVGVLAGELLHGMVDIYWSAGSVALPFLILGMGLGLPLPDAPDEPDEPDRTDEPGERSADPAGKTIDGRVEQA